MPGKLRHIVVLALAFSILTGSVGMAATVRFCAMLGVSLNASAQLATEKMSCCTKPDKPDCSKEAEKSNKKCCTVALTHQKLSLESPTKFAKVEFLSLPAALANPFPLPLVASDGPVVITGSFYSDTSPPLAGRDLLTRLQILNI